MQHRKQGEGLDCLVSICVAMAASHDKLDHVDHPIDRLDLRVGDALLGEVAEGDMSRVHAIVVDAIETENAAQLGEQLPEAKRLVMRRPKGPVNGAGGFPGAYEAVKAKTEGMRLELAACELQRPELVRCVPTTK